jgi:hypothetical protein
VKGDGFRRDATPPHDSKPERLELPVPQGAPRPFEKINYTSIGPHSRTSHPSIFNLLTGNTGQQVGQRSGLRINRRMAGHEAVHTGSATQHAIHGSDHEILSGKRNRTILQAAYVVPGHPPESPRCNWRRHLRDSRRLVAMELNQCQN